MVGFLMCRIGYQKKRTSLNEQRAQEHPVPYESEKLQRSISLSLIVCSTLKDVRQGQVCNKGHSWSVLVSVSSMHNLLEKKVGAISGAKPRVARYELEGFSYHNFAKVS